MGLLVNGNFGRFVYLCPKKKENTQMSSEIGAFLPKIGRKRWVLEQIGVIISAGCTKFFDFFENGEFVTIYVIKWYLLPQNLRFFPIFPVFSLQNR